LAGYAVECALKACIAKATRRHDFPDRVRVNACHTHKLSELLKHAGLESPMHDDRLGDSEFDGNWRLVQSWSEHSRYKRSNEADAKGLVKAVADRRHGVLAWVKHYW
jgi:hypothetical protein